MSNNIPAFVNFQHKGYTLRQFNNIWHYQIIDDASGKTVLTAACTKKLTQDEAAEIIDNFIAQLQQKERDIFKICPICNREFEPARANIVYCSELCKKKGKAIREKMKHKEKQYIKRQEKALLKAQQTSDPQYKIKKCKCCGKPFKATNQNRAYCSEGCKLKARYMREELYLERRKEKLKKKKSKPKRYKDSLCWHCEKACGGCSWSIKLIPVEGWNAKRVQNKDFNDTGIVSYTVIECPEFVEGR